MSLKELVKRNMLSACPQLYLRKKASFNSGGILCHIRSPTMAEA